MKTQKNAAKHTVARREVVGEARRRDQVGAGPQKLQTRLKPNLHARAREQRDAARQVLGPRPHAPVERSTGRTELRVELVEAVEALLARVAVPETICMSGLQSAFTLFGRAVGRQQQGPLVVLQGFQFVDALLSQLRRVAVLLI